jgi:hypothetical protein
MFWNVSKTSIQLHNSVDRDQEVNRKESSGLL